MKQLSAKVAAIAPSATIEITNKAKKMQREGIDVISLSIGEPDFDTPKHITDACIDALKKGETHYAPSNGIPELLAAISEKIVKENGFACEPDQVIVTCGAKDAIYEGMTIRSEFRTSSNGLVAAPDPKERERPATDGPWQIRAQLSTLFVWNATRAHFCRA